MPNSVKKCFYFCIIALTSSIASAGLTPQEDLTGVFQTLGNNLKATVSGTVSGSTNNSDFIGSGDVVRAVLAFDRISNESGTTGTSASLPAYAALVFSATPSSNNPPGSAFGASGQDQTMTNGGFVGSGLNTLLADSLYDASGFAYLVTSETTSFSGKTFSTLESAMSAGGSDIFVAARYELASDFAISAIQNPTGSSLVAITYSFALN
jgi:hypothetical protein